jgi:hypothetical protein
MNITAMTKDWQKEGKGIAITSRAISNVIRGYDQNDIDNMIKQIDSGISQTQAAKNNNIPRGSVARLLPAGTIIKKDLVTAKKLIKRKIKGTLKIKLSEIAEKTGYKTGTICDLAGDFRNENKLNKNR